MAATIKAMNKIATVRDGKWTCDNASLRNLLNGWVETDYPSGGDIDIGLAEAAVRRLRRMHFPAELVDHDEAEGEPGRVY